MLMRHFTFVDISICQQTHGDIALHYVQIAWLCVSLKGFRVMIWFICARLLVDHYAFNANRLVLGIAFVEHSYHWFRLTLKFSFVCTALCIYWINDRYHGIHSVRRHINIHYGLKLEPNLIQSNIIQISFRFFRFAVTFDHRSFLHFFPSLFSIQCIA